jgi:hypothetical protein
MDLRTPTVMRVIEQSKLKLINLKKIDCSGLFGGYTESVKAKLIDMMEDVRTNIGERECQRVNMEVLAMCVLGFCLSNIDEKIKNDARKKEAIILLSATITRCIWDISPQREGNTLNSSMLSENLEILYKKGIDFVK